MALHCQSCSEHLPPCGLSVMEVSIRNKRLNLSCSALLGAAGMFYAITFTPADVSILPWHYHYRHNCILRPPRDVPLL